MALTKCNVQGDVIGSLATRAEERGLTPQEFKDKFDEMPEGIKQYINEVLTEEIDAHIADYLAHKADNAYIAPELLNGWENLSIDFQSAGYIKDAHGYVHLTGIIASGVTTPGTTLFNLPLGYRPSRALQFPAFTNGGALIGGVLITILGDVQILSGGNISLSLSGISFKI